MKLSVVIPAHNEEGSIAADASSELTAALRARGRSTTRSSSSTTPRTDGTADVVGAARARPTRACAACARRIRNGFGFAVRAGLEAFTGDAVAIVMADGSDSPGGPRRLLPRCSRRATTARSARASCAGARVDGLPALQADRQPDRQPRHPAAVRPRLQRHDERLQGLSARGHRQRSSRCSRTHFNLTVEMPLKAVVRGHSYAIVPIRWTQPRARATSKLAAPGDGQPLPVHRALRLPRAPPEPRRLPASGLSGCAAGPLAGGRPAARFYEEPLEGRRSARP